MTQRNLGNVCLLVVLAVMPGCGGDEAEVTGRVTLDGKPLPSGTVVFHAPARPESVGNINPDGQYLLQTGDQVGGKPGDYKVTISRYELLPTKNKNAPPPARLATPPKYSNVTTTDLVAEVKRGRNVIDFELRSDPRTVRQ